jgi:hypothetical protein
LIGVLHALGTAAQNVSLAGMSVGLNQIIKACTPAVTLILSRALLNSRFVLRNFVFLKKLTVFRFHWSLVVATFGVVLGSCLTTYSSRSTGNVSLISIALGFVSVVAGGAEGVLIALLMRRHAVSPAQTTFLTAVPAVLSLLPLFAVMEAGVAFDAFVRDNREKQNNIVFMYVVFLSFCLAMRVAGAVVVLSVSAAAYALCHVWIIQATSAHYCNLINAVKVFMRTTTMTSFAFAHIFFCVSSLSLSLCRSFSLTVVRQFLSARF